MFNRRHKEKDKRDCPEAIFRMAKSPWQKEVALEFVKIHDKIAELSNDLKWVKWLAVGVLMTIVVDIIVKRFV